jgi:hypothetical protein
MKADPESRGVHRGRHPEQELRRLNRGFRAVSRRQERAVAFRRLWHSVWPPLLLAISLVVLFFGVSTLSPLSPMDMLKHVAAAPNCDAARLVGVAPANEGEPGYWARHDRDNDGIACEPWQQR